MEEGHCSAGNWGFPASSFLSYADRFQLLHSSATFSLALSKQQTAFSLSGKVIFYVVFNAEE